MINKRYKPGLRAIKTALSVLICLFIAWLFHRPDGFFASIAAVICMRQTYDQSYNAGLHRLIGTALGGGIGYLLLVFMHSWASNDILQIINIIFVPMCILIIIYICNVINHTASVEIGCIVLMSILLSAASAASRGDALWYVINRTIDTSMGVVVSALVNRFVLPYSYKSQKQEDVNQNITSEEEKTGDDQIQEDEEKIG